MIHELPLLFARDAFFSIFVAIGFALLFETPKKALPVAGLLGGLGHGIRFVLLYFGAGMVTSTLAGSVSIGLLGMYNNDTRYVCIPHNVRIYQNIYRRRQ